MIIISGASGGFGRAMADLLIDRVAPGELVLCKPACRDFRTVLGH